MACFLEEVGYHVLCAGVSHLLHFGTKNKNMLTHREISGIWFAAFSFKGRYCSMASISLIPETLYPKWCSWNRNLSRRQSPGNGV